MVLYSVEYPDGTSDSGVTFDCLKKIADDPKNEGAKATPNTNPGDTLILRQGWWVYDDTGLRPQ